MNTRTTERRLKMVGVQKRVEKEVGDKKQTRKKGKSTNQIQMQTDGNLQKLKDIGVGGVKK